MKELRYTNLPPADFSSIVEQYFEKCDEPSPKLIYTLPGLALYLCWKVNDILNFPKDSALYPIIELAMLKCEESIIQGMAQGRFDRQTGAMLLKNHFGYKDTVRDDKVDPNRKTISELLNEMEDEKK